MIKLFRTLVIAALVLLVIAACLPLNEPAPITISLNQPPPVWVLAAMAMFPLAVVILVAAGGLLACKRWGRWLGLLAVLASIVVAFFLRGSPLATGLSVAAVVLLVLSTLVWFAGLAASYHPVVVNRFRHGL